MLTRDLMWLGCQLVAGVICLSFRIDHRFRTFSIYFRPNLTSTTGHHLGFECDYNYHTAFWACNVIVQKID